ncbi:hypothetical protein [Spiroplasma endosymbiont of Polydrusus formosus]
MKLIYNINVKTLDNIFVSQLNQQVKYNDRVSQEIRETITFG